VARRPAPAAAAPAKRRPRQQKKPFLQREVIRFVFR
jgi:hypothetical protein